MIIFGVFLLPAMTFADTKTAPSLKATVVIPLLKNLSPEEPDKTVRAHIAEILGGPNDFGVGGGPTGRKWGELRYSLDDKSEIVVRILNGKIVEVTVFYSGGKGSEVLFTRLEG